MTSRDRVRTALDHKQPDRVPVDFGGTYETGIAAGTVFHLRRALGLDGPGGRVKVVEPYQMLGEILDDLRDALYVDTVPLAGPINAFGFPNDGWKPWTLTDGAEVLVPGKFNTVPDEHGVTFMYPQGDTAAPPSAYMPPGGYYFDSIIRQQPIDEAALDPRDNLEEFGRYSDGVLDHLARESHRLHEETDRAVVYSFTGTSYGDVANTTAPELKHPKGIRDIAEWYVSFALRPDYIREVFEGQCARGLENLALAREAVGDRVDVVKITGADYGSQRGPLISPDFYREFIKPHHVRMCSWIHKHTGWKVFMHCCGGIRPLMEDIIDAGFDVISPVQTSAAGMDPGELKAAYGDRIVFWGGGVDTQETLPFGTPADVYRQVRERIAIFNRGGGYVFNAVHNIQAGTPVENIRAMAEAVRDTF